MTNPDMVVLERTIQNSLNVIDKDGKLERPISARSLWDFRTFYLDKFNEEINPSLKMLDTLCSYAENGGFWKKFLKEHGGPFADSSEKSFYESENVFKLFYDQLDHIDTITNEALLELDAKPNRSKIIYELGICLLYRGQYLLAKKWIMKGIEISPFSPQMNFLLSLCVLSGKRPFSHKKIVIEHLIDYLKVALEAKMQEAYFLERLIHKDFYLRIGYQYYLTTPIEEMDKIPSNEILDYFTQCAGIKKTELEKIYE